MTNLLEVGGLGTWFYTRQGIVKAVDGVDFDLHEVAKIFKRTPYIASMKPGGKYVAKDLYEVGGVPVLMKALLDGGYLHGDCMTVTGKTIAENEELKAKLAAYECLGRIADAVEELTKAYGVREASIEETIFEDRLEWLVGLRSFGAKVEIRTISASRGWGLGRLGFAAQAPDIAGSTLEALETRALWSRFGL